MLVEVLLSKGLTIYLTPSPYSYADRLTNDSRHGLVSREIATIRIKKQSVP